jgi:hypothetical protein
VGTAAEAIFSSLVELLAITNRDRDEPRGEKRRWC